VASLTDARASEVRAMLDAKGLTISSLGYYPNHLHPDLAHRASVNAHLRQVIVAAQRLGVEVVGTFVGRDQTRTVRENLATFRAV
jgi:sugar phosphate isomerase/epimerase